MTIEKLIKKYKDELNQCEHNSRKNPYSEYYKGKEDVYNNIIEDLEEFKNLPENSLDHPFTDEEAIIMNNLINANNCFVLLGEKDDRAHDVNVWEKAIHDLQKILCMRTIRRMYPKYFHK